MNYCSHCPHCKQIKRMADAQARRESILADGEPVFVYDEPSVFDVRPPAGEKVGRAKRAKTVLHVVVTGGWRSLAGRLAEWDEHGATLAGGKLQDVLISKTALDAAAQAALFPKLRGARIPRTLWPCTARHWST